MSRHHTPGKPRYKQGKPCRKCGGTKYYQTSGKCFLCVRRKGQKSLVERRKKIPPQPSVRLGRKASKEEFAEAMSLIRYEDELGI